MKTIDYSKLTRSWCSVCQRNRLVKFFNKYKDRSASINGWRYYSRCIDCNKVRCREYGQNNKKQRNARLRAWRRAHPEAAKAKDLRARYKSAYGLTLEQVDTLKSLRNGRCWICGEKPKRLFIDHCHKTNKVRGCLCPSCNTFLGRIEANRKILPGIALYLDQLCHADVLLRIANEGDDDTDHRQREA